MHFKTLIFARLTRLLLGLIAFGVGIALMVRGAVGVAPWDVLAQGISLKTGIPFGAVTVLVSVAVLLLWIPIRQKPGMGTVLNALLIGPVVHVMLEILPEQTLLWVRLCMVVAGIVIIALGTGLYLGANYGPGPRDGLMTGLNVITGWPIWIVRTGIEVSVLVIGWFMGGNVGIGTLMFALLIGPMTQPAMKWFDMRKRIESKITKELIAT